MVMLYFVFLPATTHAMQGVASTCDLNPMNVSLISSSDEVTTIKMLLLKIVFVLVATMLDQFTSVQAAVMTIAMWGVVYYLFDGVSSHHWHRASRHLPSVLKQCWDGWYASLDSLCFVVA